MRPKSLYSTALLFALLLPVISAAQFGVFTKRDKFGITYNGEQITRAKYDSVVVSDQFIATAYKKKKAYYVNTEGERIAKATAESMSFSNGTGVLVNRDGEYAVVNMLGKTLYDYHECTEVRRVDNMIYIIEISRYHFKSGRDLCFTTNELITEQGRISYVDTVFFYEGLAQVQRSDIGYSDKNFRLYDTQLGVKIEENRSKMRVTDTVGVVWIDKRKTSTVYDRNTKAMVRDLKDLNFIDSTYFYGKQDNSTILYRQNSMEPMIWGNYTSIVKRQQVLHAFKSGSKDVVVIYSLQGDSIASTHLVTELDRNRYIFKCDSCLFIGSEDGAALSDCYTGIEETSAEGYRMVTMHNEFSFINDSTYERLAFTYPILFRKKPVPVESEPSLLESLFRSFVAIVSFPVVFCAPDVYLDILGVNEGSPGQEKPTILNPVTHYFSEGYVIVCLHEVKPSKGMYILEPETIVYYNYVDPAGNVLNNKKYLKCLPFKNGKAWVQTQKGFILLDTAGRRIGNEWYDEVTVDHNGNYRTTKFDVGAWHGRRTRINHGLLSPESEVIFNCEYKKLYYDFKRSGYVVENSRKTGEDGFFKQSWRTVSH